MQSEQRHTPMRVLWTGAIPDLSGYASASREYVRSLDAVGVDLAVDARSFEPWKNPTLVDRILDRRMYTLMQKDKGVPIHVIHLTPDNYKEYATNQKRRIGYFAWETSKLPVSWVKTINSTVTEVWVPCHYLANVTVESGVQIPTYVVPHAIPLPPEGWAPMAKMELPQDVYKFYSIFQWSERKNGVGLVSAYYSAFSRKDPVALVLKTYRRNGDMTERNIIRNEIAKLKRASKGVDCPRIHLVEDLLGMDDVLSIHHFCDCYVSMARSEGFGIPAFEAAAMGNPVIVPNYSAFPEHFDDSNAYLIDVPKEVPVLNMSHISPLYTPDMMWGEPSVASCAQKMLDVFHHQEDAKVKGQVARNYVRMNLDYMTIGRMMKGRLETVHKEMTEVL